MARLIQNGGLARQAKLKRDKAAVRDGIARRLCLGAPATEADLERALVEIRRILQMAEAISFV